MTMLREQTFAVVVLNDDVHTYRYVMEVLQRVVGCDEQMAFFFAHLIHNEGRAIIWTGPADQAERKRDEIVAAGPDNYLSPPTTVPLNVLVEPLPG